MHLNHTISSRKSYGTGLSRMTATMHVFSSDESVLGS